ncbi:MAG: LPS assembly lipoprotein LptE [Comamonadaceae bacterium]|nr:LPS assembly lipoprotein LptE [Comamonadaceae bacterium]RRD58048.1 hypothetical protein EII20_04470 [Comamonadaceae bacterium OH2545_COT-014]
MPPARRALLATLLTAPWLAACGFRLRRAPDLAFRSIYVDMPAASALGAELKRQLAATGQVQLITDPARRAQADVVLHGVQDARERAVVGLNAAGQVREFQLRVRFRFRLSTPAGQEVLPEDEILRQIDQSYSESAALSKEAEAQMLYQSLQSDVVQQVMQRLATVRLP